MLTFFFFIFFQDSTTLNNKMSHCTDDPDKLLNDWLGELDNLIGVSKMFTLVIARRE